MFISASRKPVPSGHQRSSVYVFPLPVSLLVAMDQNDDFSENNVNRKAQMRVPKAGQGKRSHKCNQFKFTSSSASALMLHLKMHSGEKSNKCNQCDFASTWKYSLKTHLKIHSGEKSNKCNQCDHAFLQTSALRTHLKT